jgi:hypothetical protein
VLWQKHPDERYEVRDAFPLAEFGGAYPACVRLATTYQKQRVFQGALFICLPDTVDPRGAKGK